MRTGLSSAYGQHMAIQHKVPIAMIWRAALLVLVEAQTPSASGTDPPANFTGAPRLTPPPPTSIIVTLLNNGAFITVIVLAVVLGIFGFGRDKIFGNRFEQMRESLTRLGADARASLTRLRGSVSRPFRPHHRLHKAIEAAQRQYNTPTEDGPPRTPIPKTERLGRGGTSNPKHKGNQVV